MATPFPPLRKVLGRVVLSPESLFVCGRASLFSGPRNIGLSGVKCKLGTGRLEGRHTGTGPMSWRESKSTE